MGKLVAALAQVNGRFGKGDPENWEKWAPKLRYALIREALTSDWTVAEFNVGHFDISGFLTKGDKIVYFSMKDTEEVLLRTASSLTDYTGGTNHFTNMQSFEAYMEKF